MAGITQKQKKHLRGNRTIAVIAGIALVLLGILFFVRPLTIILFAGIFVVIGLLLYGAYLIIAFIAAPQSFRNGWQLAQGIIMTACAAAILVSGAASIIELFSILLGVVALIIGVSKIVGHAAVRGIQGAGFILASGIINTLLALFLIFTPFVAAAAVGMVEGIYLCVTGVAFIIEGFAKRPVTL